MTGAEFLLGALTGVFGNVITAVVAAATKKSFEKAKRQLGLIAYPEDILGPILSDAQAGAARVAAFGREEISRFLLSTDVENLLVGVFAGYLLEENQEGVMESTRQSFISSMALHLQRPESSICEHGNWLFDLLIRCSEASLNAAIEQGVLAAHEVKSTLRYSLLRDLLTSMAKRQEYLGKVLQGQIMADVPAILQYEDKYREIVEAQVGTITPPNLDNQKAYPIDSLYVTPDVEGPNSTESGRVGLQELCDSVYRTVILGDPGGGKSTLVRKIAHDLCVHPSTRQVAGRRLTPVLVVLREYHKLKMARGLSILQFIEGTANTDQQCSPPPGAFEYLLRNGRLLVIFDGLDELSNSYDRQRIRNDVDAFSRNYPGTPLIVTSRKTGYDAAPLDPTRFDSYSIAPFSDSQVAEYVRKWFSLGKTATVDERQGKASSFLNDSAEVPDLRSNPLMLALMCDIFWREGYIPQNRPQVYRDCATLLFRQWDSTRGIEVPAVFVEHLETTLQYLAYHIYSDPSLQAGVSERALADETVNFLLDGTYEEKSKARIAAQDLIRHCCKGRAWVFSQSDRLEEGEALYKFAHRTFLEYFTAGYLLEKYYKPDTLWAFLSPKIAAQEWDMVSQLSFQMQGKNAREELYELLIRHIESLPIFSRWNFLFFLAQSVTYLNPKPTTVRRVTEICLAECLQWGSTILRGNAKGAGQSIEVGAVITHLVSATSQNFPYVADTIEATLHDALYNADRSTAQVAVEITYRWIQHYRIMGKARDRGLKLAAVLVNKHEARQRELALKSLFVAKALWATKLLSLSEALDMYGLDFITQAVSYSLAPSTTWPPIVDQLLDFLLYGNASTWALDALRSLGQRLPTLSPSSPWGSPRQTPGSAQRRGKFSLPEHEPDILLGAFGVLALSCEGRQEKYLPARKSPFWTTPIGQDFAHILSSRMSPNVEVDDIIRRRFRREIDRAFVSAWTTGEASLGSDGAKSTLPDGLVHP